VDEPSTPDSAPDTTTEPDPVTVQEVARSRTGPWIFAAAAVLGGGVAVSAFTDDSPTVQTPIPVTEQVGVTTTQAPDASVDPSTSAASGTATPDDAVEADEPRRESIDPSPEVDEDLLIYGYRDDFEFVRVTPATGEVEFLAPGQGDEFLPLNSTNVSLIGAASSTGVFFSLNTDGSGQQVDFDILDAPLFFPAADGSGYLRYGAWTGEIAYLDHAGTLLSVGVTIPRGSQILVDTSQGPLVKGLDGRVRVIDPTSGDALRVLATEPIVVGTDRILVIRCADLTCQVVVEQIDETNQLILNIDPQLAHRVVTGISPDDRWLTMFNRGDLVLVDSLLGEEAARFDGMVDAEVSWLGSEVAAVHAKDGTVVLWDANTGAKTPLDLTGIIAPRARGLWLLEASS
jgi:hypothetical protein